MIFNPKVCFLASSGGHLAQIFAIRNLTSRERRFFVTMPTKDAYTSLSNEKAFYLNLKLKSNNIIANQLNRVFSLFFILIQSIKIIKKNKFDYVFTTGANIGIIFCLISWLSGKKIFFIESYAGITRFGKLLHLISFKTFVQWESQLNSHKGSELIPPLYNSLSYSSLNHNFSNEYIYVSVGSTEYQFDRLLKFMDKIKSSLKIKVIGQIGNSSYSPSFYTQNLFFKNTHMKLMKNCKFFVTHGGSSNLWDSQRMKIKTVIVPRLSKYGEHIDDHQLFLTSKYSSTSKVANSYDELKDALFSDFKNKQMEKTDADPVTSIIEKIEEK